jgi:hypothetical protein
MVMPFYPVLSSFMKSEIFIAVQRREGDSAEDPFLLRTGESPKNLLEDSLKDYPLFIQN